MKKGVIEGKVMRERIKQKLAPIVRITKKPNFKALSNAVTFVILLVTIIFIVSIYF